MRQTLLFLVLSCMAIAGYAQAPYIFTKFDLVNGSGGSNPENFYVCNGKLFFTATTAAAGTELWVTDGTQAGTKMVLDINPGAASAFDMTTYKPGFIEYNSKLYFSALSSGNGYELWVSDGTTAGTNLVKDLYPGTFGSVWHQKAVYNGKLYFGADEGTTSNAAQELYVTDGTAAGTTMLKDINSGSVPSAPKDFTVCNGKLFFTADLSPALYGRELWVTDGTSAGTQLVKDINPGLGSSFSTILAQHTLLVLGTKLLFAADNGTNGEELWISDGTATGTTMVRDIKTGSGSSSPFVMNWYGYYNSKVYFWASGMSQIWATDGTAMGTVNIGPLNIFQPPSVSGMATPNAFAAYKGRLFFAASDHSVPNPDTELWVTDGTTLGTKLVKDICTTSVGFNGSQPYQLMVYKNMLYFQAQATSTAGGDYQLYKCDSTAAGTVKLAPTGSTSVNPFTSLGSFINYNGSIYFTAAWGATTDNELWSMKDTTGSAGIRTIAQVHFNLYPNPSDGNFTIDLGNQPFEKGTVSVYDMMGKEVYQSQIENHKSQITISEAKGIYLVKLQLDDAVLTKRMVVE